MGLKFEKTIRTLKLSQNDMVLIKEKVSSFMDFTLADEWTNISRSLDMSHPCMCFTILSAIFLRVLCWRWWNDIVHVFIVYVTIGLYVVAAGRFSMIICHYYGVIRITNVATYMLSMTVITKTYIWIFFLG